MIFKKKRHYYHCLRVDFVFLSSTIAAAAAVQLAQLQEEEKELASRFFCFVFNSVHDFPQDLYFIGGSFAAGTLRAEPRFLFFYP